MPSGKLTAQFDNVAPSAPNAGESVIYPLGPSGDWYQRLPNGNQTKLSKTDVSIF